MLIRTAMSHKLPMLSNTGTHDKVRDFVTFSIAVNEVDGITI